MREVLENFPGAQRALFRRYHIGGCSSCGFSPDETLAQVCARNGNLDVAALPGHGRSIIAVGKSGRTGTGNRPPDCQ